ncbi:unnamed protein product, partial [marine sediment metagenome]
IIKKGNFYIVELSSARLNNDGDFVILYNVSGKKIDETQLLEETTRSDKTWQLCETWEFIESTKGEENNCGTEDDQTIPPINDTDTDENGETDEPTIETISTTNNDKASNGEPIPITLDTITLNPKVIKSENDSENNKDLGDYAIYGFVVFCVL